MQGKTHENIKTVRPLKDGVIADFQVTEKMLNAMEKIANRVVGLGCGGGSAILLRSIANSISGSGHVDGVITTAIGAERGARWRAGGPSKRREAIGRPVMRGLERPRAWQHVLVVSEIDVMCLARVGRVERSRMGKMCAVMMVVVWLLAGR